jgi:hypothetical protein
MMHTKAELMLDRWLNDMEPIESPEALAREIDPRVRVEGYLYTSYQRFIYSDGSKALFSRDTLTLGG